MQYIDIYYLVYLEFRNLNSKTVINKKKIYTTIS